MRLTIVAHDIGGPGGMERVLTELISGLLANGWRLTVISRTCSLPSHPCLTWIRVPGPSRPFPLAYPWFYLLGSLITWRRRTGMVLTTGAIVFNRTDWCAVHLCHHATQALGVSRLSRRTWPYRLNTRLGLWMSRNAERLCFRPVRTGGLIGVSRGVSEELGKYFPRMRVVTVPNGVNLEAFAPDALRRRQVRDSYQIASEQLLAVFVGSEWERKGLKAAIASLSHAPGWQLLVVGAGDIATYRRFAEERGVSALVKFVGLADDPGPFYCAGDAFVLPTSYETFSLVTYEAAASGLPLLVTPVSGVTDLLVDGENGWFIEPNPVEIGLRLSALGDDAPLRARVGSAGRRAAARFTWRRMVASYERVLVEGSEATTDHERRATHHADVADSGQLPPWRRRAFN